MGKGSIAALAAATALLAAASPASATYMRLVSTPSGVPGPGPTSEPEKPDSTYPAISADGRYIAFPSERSDLVPGDTNGRTDIFVRDLQTDTTERVSLTSAGAQATSPTGRDDEMFFSPPAISADGRYVAFDSLATDLVPGDTNGAADIFVRDRLMGTTERASVAGAEIQADGHSFPGVSISADGRYVTFQTGATNLDDYLQRRGQGPPGDEDASRRWRVRLVGADLVVERRPRVFLQLHPASAWRHPLQPGCLRSQPRQQCGSTRQSVERR